MHTREIEQTTQKWCCDCKQVVMAEEYREYESGWHTPFYVVERCSECKGDELTNIKVCPICGQDMSADGTFCEDCLNNFNQLLTEYMESNGLTQDMLEDLVAVHFGW